MLNGLRESQVIRLHQEPTCTSEHDVIGGLRKGTVKKAVQRILEEFNERNGTKLEISHLRRILRAGKNPPVLPSGTTLQHISFLTEQLLGNLELVLEDDAPETYAITDARTANIIDLVKGKTTPTVMALAAVRAALQKLGTEVINLLQTSVRVTPPQVETLDTMFGEEHDMFWVRLVQVSDPQTIADEIWKISYPLHRMTAINRLKKVAQNEVPELSEERNAWFGLLQIEPGQEDSSATLGEFLMKKRNIAHLVRFIAFIKERLAYVDTVCKHEEALNDLKMHFNPQDKTLSWLQHSPNRIAAFFDQCVSKEDRRIAFETASKKIGKRASSVAGIMEATGMDIFSANALLKGEESTLRNWALVFSYFKKRVMK